MVDKKRRREASDSSTGPTVASILGLSGPLRFRLHGSNQKPHLILRRVAVPDDSDGEPTYSEKPTTAYYSLFAQKRIEVKPGKEILLAIEGEFNDKPVLIGGNLPGSESEPNFTSVPTRATDTRQGGTQTNEKLKDKKLEDDVTSRASVLMEDEQKEQQDVTLTVPPKMRKAWMRGRQSLPDSEALQSRPVLPLREEVGVQAQPEYMSVVVETTSTPRISCAIQTVNETADSVVQATVNALPPFAEATKQRVVRRKSEFRKEGSSESSPMDMSSGPPTPLQSDEVHPLSIQYIQSDAVLSSKELNITPGFPQRGISPSSSASSSPDELDIKLITDVVNTRDNAKPTVPITPHSGAVYPPPSPLNESPVPNGGMTSPSSASSPALATASSSKVTMEQIPFHPSARNPVTESKTSQTRNAESSWKYEKGDSLNRIPIPTSVGTQGSVSSYSRPILPASQPVRAIPDMSLFRGPSTPDMYNFRGHVGATGTWGTPIPVSGSHRENVRTPIGEEKSNLANKTPPDLRSLVNLSSSSTDNPLGIRPSNLGPRMITTSYLPVQPRSVDPPPIEPKKSLIIGNSWPQKSKNGSSNSTPLQAQKTRSSNSNPNSPLEPSDLGPKWKRIDGDAVSRQNSADPSPVTIKSEPEADAIPLASPQSTGSIRTNGKPPPNFVGYTPPNRLIAPASAQNAGSTSLSPQVPAPPAESPSRGVKRPASSETIITSLASPTSSNRMFKGPVETPVHVAQLQGTVEVKYITFNSNGSQFAVCCSDSSVRIWNNISHLEVAKLAHVAPVVSVVWMDGDAGVVSLGDTGEVSKWTRVGSNQWHWAKLLDASIDHRPGTNPTSLAFMRDRIAIAFPRVGVKVWLWVKGMWQPQRSILRQNVTSIKFVEEGEALLGGTADGVLWYCQIPNGTLRAYSFFKTGVYLLDVNLTGSQLLVSRHAGVAHLVNVVQDDRQGKSEREYSLKDEISGVIVNELGAVFTNMGKSIMFGTIDGCLLVWDKNRIVGGLDHGKDIVIQAVANFEPRRGFPGNLITGTKNGLLSWWDYPPMATNENNKRLRTQ